MVKNLSDKESLFSMGGILYPAYSLYGENADDKKNELMLISAVKFRTALPCKDVSIKLSEALIGRVAEAT